MRNPAALLFAASSTRTGTTSCTFDDPARPTRARTHYGRIARSATALPARQSIPPQRLNHARECLTNISETPDIIQRLATGPGIRHAYLIDPEIPPWRRSTRAARRVLGRVTPHSTASPLDVSSQSLDLFPMPVAQIQGQHPRVRDGVSQNIKDGTPLISTIGQSRKVAFPAARA